MKTAVLYSVCECQARLGVELDEHRVVIRGWAKDPRRGQEILAPANAMRTDSPRFDVGWMCPICTRNTLRSFDAASLAFREARAS
jgi:hypothetical protein